MWKSEEEFLRVVFESDLQLLARWIATETRDDGPCDIWKERLLIASSYAGNSAVVDFLLSHNTDANAHDEDGITALMAACKAGNLSIVQALVKAGAEVNCTDRIGRSALHWLATEGDHLDVAKYLASEGANLKLAALDGSSPYEYAKALNRVALCQFLA